VSIKRHGGSRFSGDKQLDTFLPGDKYIVGDEAMKKRRKPQGVRAHDSRVDAAIATQTNSPVLSTTGIYRDWEKESGPHPAPLSRHELWKQSPALALTQEMMMGGNPSVQAKLTARSNVPDRAIALQYYHSLLASCVAGKTRIVLAANATGAEFPQCIEVGSIVHAAVHQMNDVLAKAGAPSLTEKETRDFTRIVNEELSSQFYHRLREARLFQFRERDYLRLYKMADVFTTTAVGYKWTPANPEDPFKKAPWEERKKTAEYTCTEGVKVPFPEKLPFDSCYFAWGGGVPPTETQCSMWGFDPNKVNLIMGTLVTESGWAFTLTLRGNSKTVAIGDKVEMAHTIILERIGDRGDTSQFQFHIDRIGDVATDKNIGVMNPGWTLPYGFVPWMVAYTINLIDRMAPLTKVSPHTLKERLLFKALSKRTGHKFLPPPYYPVLIQPSIYEEMEKKIESQAREWSHRWDVRGHYAHKVMRGTLPLDPKVIHNLTKRKYVLYHALNRPSAEVLTILAMRRVLPPREGEWIAHLKSYKKAYVKGPADKPYVPSLHRVRGGVPEVV
jgi:hypothetical protein